MKKAIASGLVGLIALGGAAVAVPSAFAQTDDDTTTTREERQQERSERLDELVANGVISQEQADQMRARFEDRQERHEQRIATLTELLGVSDDDLRAAHEAGQSLADVAAAQGVDVQTLIDVLVAEATADIEAKAAEGELDADRVAEITADLEDRITARVNGERPEGFDGEGRRGFGPRGHHGPRGGFGPGALGDG
jgi:membrane peptidoglycan carboxypeptidase